MNITSSICRAADGDDGTVLERSFYNCETEAWSAAETNLQSLLATDG